MKMCIPHVCSAHESQGEVSDPLGLKLQETERHRVGAET